MIRTIEEKLNQPKLSEDDRKELKDIFLKYIDEQEKMINLMQHFLGVYESYLLNNDKDAYNKISNFCSPLPLVIV